jgi:archaellum component FlaD/FlaE
MHIEFGNASLVETQGTGWIVGFSEWAQTGGAHLRYMPQDALAHTLCMKWFHHL